MNRVTLLSVLLVGCSDYELSDGPKTAPAPVETVVSEPPVTTPEPTTPAPEPSCEDVPLDGWVWVASAPFADEGDPVDGGGLPFWDPWADLSGWNSVVLPDLEIPIGEDRAYVASFDLSALPLNLSLNVQSDDGLWVWVNGVLAGHWGGEWQAEGCVNENAQCLVTMAVPPVDVTSLLQLGPNTIAARVSNPVLNAYFEILPECLEAP